MSKGEKAHYMLFRASEDEWRVHKVGPDGADLEIYEVKAGLCSCPAGSHGRQCKHLDMVKHGVPPGTGVSLKDAKGAFLSLRRKVRETSSAVCTLAKDGGYEHDAEDKELVTGVVLVVPQKALDPYKKVCGLLLGGGLRVRVLAQ